MKKLKFNLAPQVEKQLNNFQIDFIKLAYNRMATIAELLDMEKSAQVDKPRPIDPVLPKIERPI